MTALSAARAKGDRGIASSINHAGDAWADSALTMVRWFAKVKQRQHYLDEDHNEIVYPAWTMEECRLWAAAHDLPEPPDARAWGAVTRRALSEGLIVRTGQFRPTAASNGGLKALYRKA